MNERTKHLGNGLKDQLTLLRRRLLQRGRSNRNDIDELIQEAFLRLCRYQQEQKTPVRDPVAFLLDVVEHVHIDRLRRSVLTQRIFSDQPIEELPFLTNTEGTPDQEVEAHELLERIERRLAVENPHVREAFLLHRFEGLSYVEISQKLKISTATVKRHIAKAMLLCAAEQQFE
jgi:RNA polymerase sigma-70 factor (ECF subfamily)